MEERAYKEPNFTAKLPSFSRGLLMVQKSGYSNQLIKVVVLMQLYIYRFFNIPGGCLDFIHHQKYDEYFPLSCSRLFC